VFTIDAIVLKKNSIKENKNLFHLFSKDFGKINAWINESKLKYPIDL
jgi:recombinational DNA repair protein (RecF pathway)